MRCTRPTGCNGRMKPVDVLHPEKVDFIDGVQVVIEEAKIIRVRRCKVCGWRNKTGETPIGDGWQGPLEAISDVDPIEEAAEDNRPRLFDMSE